MTTTRLTALHPRPPLSQQMTSCTVYRLIHPRDSSPHTRHFAPLHRDDSPMDMGQNVYGRPWGETSSAQWKVYGANRSWGEMSMGRTVHGTKSPDTSCRISYSSTTHSPTVMYQYVYSGFWSHIHHILWYKYSTVHYYKHWGPRKQYTVQKVLRLNQNTT